MRRTTRAKVSRDREAQQMARRLRDRLNPGEGQEARIKAEPGQEEDMDDEEEAVIKEEEESDARLAAAKQFREVHFDRWLDMFIKVLINTRF